MGTRRSLRKRRTHRGKRRGLNKRKIVGKIDSLFKMTRKKLWEGGGKLGIRGPGEKGTSN